MKKELYKPFKSTRTGKKYSVYVMGSNGKPKLIHFGSTKYEQYQDKIGLYSHLDHKDKKRRENYRKRASGIRNKKGELTYKDKNTANYFSYNFLW